MRFLSGHNSSMILVLFLTPPRAGHFVDRFSSCSFGINNRTKNQYSNSQDEKEEIESRVQARLVSLVEWESFPSYF